MKANTKDAKIVPMVKMPLLGSVVPTFTHKNLRVLESLVGKKIGDVLSEPDSVANMDATVYAAAYQAATKTDGDFDTFCDALDDMKAKDFMKLTKACYDALSEAFGDEDAESDEDAGDEKNAPEAPQRGV